MWTMEDISELTAAEIIFLRCREEKRKYNTKEMKTEFKDKYLERKINNNTIGCHGHVCK